MCADIDEQRATDDKRRAGKTPRWAFGPGFRGDIFLPDNVAVGRIQTDQHSVLAQRIHAIAIDGGCAARTTIIILRIELSLVDVRPDHLAGCGVETKHGVFLLAPATSGVTERVNVPVGHHQRRETGTNLGLPKTLGAVIGPLGQPAGLA